jgi:hypothetical protein
MVSAQSVCKILAIEPYERFRGDRILPHAKLSLALSSHCTLTKTNVIQKDGIDSSFWPATNPAFAGTKLSSGAF